MQTSYNPYFGNQSDVFGRPSYMYGSPQRSPYIPQQPYMLQQTQPMKGGNPYQSRPPQQPMKGGVQPNPYGSGFNPYGGGYQPQPQKGGSPYRNTRYGSFQPQIDQPQYFGNQTLSNPDLSNTPELNVQGVTQGPENLGIGNTDPNLDGDYSKLISGADVGGESQPYQSQNEILNNPVSPSKGGSSPSPSSGKGGRY